MMPAFYTKENAMPEHTLRELFDLSGKVAIVTGGAGYLGAAMSEALADAGARVVVASRDLAKCEGLAKTMGAYHLGLAYDQEKPESIAALVDQTIERLGRIDVLVNNAYRGPLPSIDTATPEDFARALNTGVTGYFLLAREAARHMRAVGGGSIINIASMYGVVGSYPEVYVGTKTLSPPNYHAVKGAVVHLTRHLAVYWAKDGIRVNAISPGPFPHDTTRQEMPEFIRRLETKVPMGRMGEPWELKGAVALLASRAGSYITGQNIMVDGGWTAW
jgi:gluconate 5-dehydrogenase